MTCTCRYALPITVVLINCSGVSDPSQLWEAGSTYFNTVWSTERHQFIVLSLDVFFITTTASPSSSSFYPPLLTIFLLDLVNQIITKAQDSDLSRQVQNSERIQVVIKSDESSQLLKEQEGADAEIGWVECLYVVDHLLIFLLRVEKKGNKRKRGRKGAIINSKPY